MTINKLQKILSKLIKEGHGRKPVTVNKKTFSHNLESDGCCILNVESTYFGWIPRIGEDGGYAENEDGSTSGRNNLVLLGEDSESEDS